jgi:hypothetical protein
MNNAMLTLKKWMTRGFIYFNTMQGEIQKTKRNWMWIAFKNQL